MNTSRLAIATLAAVLLGLGSPDGRAADIVVNNDAQFAAALAGVATGDRILLAPGTYAGQRFLVSATGITIRSLDPANPATIQGGTFGFQLSRATNVAVESLRFANQSANALVFEDGGDYAAQVATDISIRDVTIESAGGVGIQLAGVYRFVIDQVEILGWSGLAAIDIIGGHDGVVQNSRIVQTGSGLGTGIRARGGSTNVVIRANRVDQGTGTRRGIQAGGSTGIEFFRPPLQIADGQPDFEATDIEIEGNVVTGGDGSVTSVGTDRVVIRNNYLLRPARWAIRFLNENSGGEWGATRNTQVLDNVVVFASSPSSLVNVGAGTDPASFVFARNRWYNESNPAASTPTLPVAETDGVYGVNPIVDPDDLLVQTFAWGQWLLNLTTAEETYAVSNAAGYRLAVPGAGAGFDLSLANPFVGTWTYVPLAGNTLALPPFTQAYLVPAPPVAAVPVPPVMLGVLALVLAAVGWRMHATAARPSGAS